MRLISLMLLCSVAFAMSQEEQDKAWAEAMRESAAKPGAAPTKTVTTAKETTAGREVTRADVDAAGAVYVETVLAYYMGLVGKIERPTTTAIHDSMTVKQAQEARRSNTASVLYDELLKDIQNVRQKGRPAHLVMRANSLDLHISVDGGGTGEDRRKMLGLPDPPRR